MDFEAKMCLGIAVPQSIRDFMIAGPQPQPSTTDALVRAEIERFGEEHDLPPAEIDKACQLASGSDDLVILLERPADNHAYMAPFGAFVRDCHTLQAVDEMIRFVTRESRSIYNTSVLDAFMFKPLNRQDRYSNTTCHDLVEVLLRIKKPHTLLACCKDIESDHWLKRFRGYRHDARRVQTIPGLELEDIGGQQVRTVRSSHPGYCINHVIYNPELRMKMILGLAMAFARTEENQRQLIEAASKVSPISNR
ncbi:hypothetical protein K461DRAFT_324659, partial [Myriangium duriaei CBS 260.36]